MNNANNTNDILSQLEAKPPKIIGGYKKPGWAVKTLDKISNDPTEVEDDGSVTAKAVLMAANETYYPAFLTLDMKEGGKVIGAYLIAEDEENYNLIPFEMAKGFMKKQDEELTPFRYRTLVKLDGDVYQQKWPDYS
ncbi:hypothetical protein G6549_01415 [Bacillus sp. MM2020_1]|nr:hypothetical protein [Bacillus sp. MM2020_1]